MVRHAPKLLMAGAVTGLTDATHVTAVWLARVLPDSWAAGPAEEIAAWAVIISSIFLVCPALKLLGHFFRGLGNACLGASNLLGETGAWVARNIERLVRRALFKVSVAARHWGLKLAR